MKVKCSLQVLKTNECQLSCRFAKRSTSPVKIGVSIGIGRRRSSAEEQRSVPSEAVASMPETLPATATVTASSIDCTVAVLKVPTPTLQLPEVCNLQSLGLIMEPNNINIELNPAALVTPAMEPVGFKVSQSSIKKPRSYIIFLYLKFWLQGLNAHRINTDGSFSGLSGTESREQHDIPEVLKRFKERLVEGQ